jgi:hypothetical protein
MGQAIDPFTSELFQDSENSTVAGVLPIDAFCNLSMVGIHTLDGLQPAMKVHLGREVIDNL